MELILVTPSFFQHFPKSVPHLYDGAAVFPLAWKSPPSFSYLTSRIKSIDTLCGISLLSVFHVGPGLGHSLDLHFHSSAHHTGLGTSVSEEAFWSLTLCLEFSRGSQSSSRKHWTDPYPWELLALSELRLADVSHVPTLLSPYTSLASSWQMAVPSASRWTLLCIKWWHFGVIMYPPIPLPRRHILPGHGLSLTHVCPTNTQQSARHLLGAK